MIHALCDFCGNDCERNATLLTMQPFSDFARYHTDHKPYGVAREGRSFVICENCAKIRNLPNPYETYKQITEQKIGYQKTIENYTDVDFVEDWDE